MDGVGCRSEYLCDAPGRAWDDAVKAGWLEETSRHTSPSLHADVPYRPLPDVYGHAIGTWRDSSPSRHHTEEAQTNEVTETRPPAPSSPRLRLSPFFFLPSREQRLVAGYTPLG